MEISRQGFHQGKLLGTAPVKGSGRDQDWAEEDASCDEVPPQAPGTQWGALELGWSSKVVLSWGRELALYTLMSISHWIECGLPRREV